jgi:hypothetical protein
MLLPLAFLIISCIAFLTLGLFILAVVPSYRLTVLNLVVFVLGAVPGAILFLFLCGKLVAGDQLSDRAFYGIFPVLLVGGASFGALAVWVKIRISIPRNGNSTR